MKASFLLSLALSGYLGTLSGAPIKIADTGANGSGVDANYVISVSTDSSLPANAPAKIIANPIWAAPLAGSAWINPSGNGATNYCAACYYAFTTTFDLTGLNPLSAVLSGRVMADDEVALNLNGSWVTSWIGNYTIPTNFTIGSQYSSLFRNGVNTLAFVVENTGGPMALDATVSGTADASAVPEPGAAGLIGGAGLLLVVAGLLRKKSGPVAQAAAERQAKQS